MTERYLIVGLGNPGREYEQTRHNIGFRCVDAIAAAYGLTFNAKQAKALIADGTIEQSKVLLAKPQTYMNLSGEAVRALVNFYKIPLPNILVIMDDMDIPLGTLRIRMQGGSGGQNGMKHILAQLGTQEISRIRFGIGRPPGRMDPAAFILQDFGKDEHILLVETLDRVVKAVKAWLTLGMPIAMNRHNGTAEEAARNADAGAHILASVDKKPKPSTSQSSEQPE